MEIILRLELLPSFDGLKTLDLSGTKIGLQDTSSGGKGLRFRGFQGLVQRLWAATRIISSHNINRVQSESLGARALRRCSWPTWA